MAMGLGWAFPQIHVPHNFVDSFIVEIAYLRRIRFIEMGVSSRLFISASLFMIAASLEHDVGFSMLENVGDRSAEAEMTFRPGPAISERRTREKRIVGGERVEIGAYPYLALTKGRSFTFAWVW